MSRANNTIKPSANINFSTHFHVLEPFSTKTLIAKDTLSLNSEISIMQNCFHDFSNIQLPTFIVVVSWIIFGIGALANSAVLILRCKSRKWSRASLIKFHLAVADLAVIFMCIIELSGGFSSGNILSRITMFTQHFGANLSSFLTAVLALDRYFVMLHPLQATSAELRRHIMLASAWSASLVISIPQIFVSRVSQHPQSPEFEQCVSFGFFANEMQLITYNAVCVVLMNLIPLTIIIFAQSKIFWSTLKMSTNRTKPTRRVTGRTIKRRRSNIRNVKRARSRSLRMTVVTGAVFACCWLPHVTITLWYLIDKESAMQVSPKSRGIYRFMTFYTSSFSPIIYGLYVVRFTPKGNRDEFDRIREQSDCLNAFCENANPDIAGRSLSLHSDPNPQIQDAHRDAENHESLE